MPSVIQVNFNPTNWSAGGGVGTAMGDNGYDAFSVYLDPDGVTAWAFEYFGAGFARFNITTGAIVHDDAILGIPGFSNSLYTTEDGSAFFATDDLGHYFTILNQATLYKSHVAAGPGGNLFNGYMIDDATLALTLGGFSSNLEGWTSTIVPASDGGRYLALANGSGNRGIYVYDTTTMSLVGKYTNGDNRFWRAFMDKNGDFWFVTANPGFPNDVNLVFWHPANGATLGALNVTVHPVTAATLGTTTHGIQFGTYVPSNHSVVLGNSINNTGELVNISLTTFTQNAFHADDLMLFYNGTFDAPISAFERGVQPSGSLGFSGANGVSQVTSTEDGGYFNVVDPTTLTQIGATLNITSIINASAPTTPIPPQHIGGFTLFATPPHAAVQWSETAGVLLVTYEFVGSPVYIVSVAPPVTLPTVTTQAETSITATTAVGNGNITSLGGAANNILEGFVFDTVSHALPGNVAPGSSGYAFNATTAGVFSTGPYTTSMTGLTPSTTYFVRAVTQNSAGYSYGNQISFATTAAVLNSATPVLVSSLAPSHFEEEVTFTCTVSDPITGDPNPNTAPLGTVQFVADGSFGFGSASLTPLTASPTAVQSSATVATYTAANNFSAGQKVTITGYIGPLAQFSQTNVSIATANSSSFTVNGVYTVHAQTNAGGTATSTSASSCSASTTVLIAGLHTIQGQYLGDPTPITGHSPSNSNILVQQVVAVSTLNTVEFPGFALIGTFTTAGDGALLPQAQLEAIPSATHAHVSISLLWTTLNVFYVRITGNNGVDYQPLGFDTGLISTSGSGIYVVGSGFTASITLTLQAYDNSQNPLAGVTSSVHIVIS